MMVFLTGTLLFASFLGWGQLLSSKISGASTGHQSWPLNIVLGMSLTLQVASLCLLVGGLPVPTLWSIWIGLGILICFTHLRRRQKKIFPDAHEWQTIVVLGLCWIPIFLSALTNQNYNCHDDNLAYLYQIQLILQKGTLVDPFSLRRLASFGGQQILQSFFVLLNPSLTLHTFELGFLQLLAAILMYQLAVKNISHRWALVVAIVLLWLPEPRINTAATNSALCIFLGLILFQQSQREASRARAMIEGLLLASLLYLRANYIVVIAIWCSIDPWLTWKSKKTLNLWGLTLATLLSLCSIGALQLWISSKTPFFPLISGNFVKSFGTFHGIGFKRPILPFLERLLVESSFLNLTFAGLILAFFSRDRFALWIRAFFCSAFLFVLTSIALFHAYAPYEVYRYCFPFIVATVFLMTLESIRQLSEAKGFTRRLALGTCLLILVLSPIGELVIRLKTYMRLETSWIQSTSRQRDELQAHENNERTFYRSLQQQLPPLSHAIMMVENPALFDLRRNDFTSLDIIGNVSPKQSFDPEASDEQIDLYFRSLGFQYLVFEDPEKSLCEYSKNSWLLYIKGGYIEKIGKKFQMRDRDELLVPSQVFWATRYLSFFDYLERKKTNRQILSSGQLYAVPLTDEPK